ncbi:MAG: hypothetical protein COB71_11300 [Thiotrichales bacterium]|nr:MAG: hypothetical protein COB71_11300 [Thiotrichales bacterium]
MATSGVGIIDVGDGFFQSVTEEAPVWVILITGFAIVGVGDFGKAVLMVIVKSEHRASGEVLTAIIC